MYAKTFKYLYHPDFKSTTVKTNGHENGTASKLRNGSQNGENENGDEKRHHRKHKHKKSRHLERIVSNIIRSNIIIVI